MRLIFYSFLFLTILSSCKVKKVKDVVKVDSVAHVARNESKSEFSVLLDTSKIVTENRTYIEVLNDSGKVVQRVFSYEIKRENKAIAKTEKKITDISEKTSVKVSKVAVKKDKEKTPMLKWSIFLILFAVVIIWINFKKK